MLKNQYDFALLRKKYQHHVFAENFLVEEVGQRLFSQLEFMKIEPLCIIHAGVNNESLNKALKKRYSRAEIKTIDIMKASYEEMPFEDNSVDLIVANLAFTWTNDIDRVFQECFRLLKKEGLLIFTLFGVDTFAQWRAAMQAVGLDHTQHFPLFYDMHNMGDALIHAKFAEPVMDMEHIVLRYKTMVKLMEEIKNLTGPNILNNRVKHCLGKNKWQAVCDYYAEHFTEAERYQLTLEIIYGHAWVGNNKNTVSINDQGEVLVPISSLRAK